MNLHYGQLEYEQQGGPQLVALRLATGAWSAAAAPFWSPEDAARCHNAKPVCPANRSHFRDDFGRKQTKFGNTREDLLS